LLTIDLFVNRLTGL